MSWKKSTESSTAARVAGIAVPNNIALDQTNPEARTVSHPLLRKHAFQSARLRIDEPDKCPEDLLNRILWHAMKGPDAAYPEWAVTKIKDED